MLEQRSKMNGDANKKFHVVHRRPAYHELLPRSDQVARVLNEKFHVIHEPQCRVGASVATPVAVSRPLEPSEGGNGRDTRCSFPSARTLREGNEAKPPAESAEAGTHRFGKAESAEAGTHRFSPCCCSYSCTAPSPIADNSQTAQDHQAELEEMVH